MAALMFWHMKVLLYTVFKDLTIRRVVTRTLTIKKNRFGCPIVRGRID
jgi:hypothetical protein